MKEVVEKLIKLNKTISTMESCTGGALAYHITNVEGSSLIFKFGAITYANDFKIKMGVSEELINKYSVYSMEVARNMSYTIGSFTNSDYGVGITGKLNKEDPNNKFGADDIIYISIYDKSDDIYHELILQALPVNRKENKEMIVANVAKKMLEIL